MRFFKVKIANRIIEITTIYEQSFLIWKNFLIEGEPDFRVTVISDEIDEERKKTGDVVIDDNTIEFQLLLRKISEKLVSYDTFLLHGAAISVDNEGYIFSGKSGIGKSTHILKWLVNLPGTIDINGDKPFIHVEKTPIVCGSPWGGKERLYTNIQVPLKAIILLERSNENSIEKVRISDVFPQLCEQIYRPLDEGKDRKTLQLLKALSPTVSFWRFKCNNFKKDCFSVAYNALIK